MRRWSLGSPCVFNDVYISVNRIMTNRLIFSTEERVFIYDQYFLTQSACQVRKHFGTRFPGVKISSRSTYVDLICRAYKKFQATKSDFYI